MTTRVSQLIVRLIDGVSGPASRAGAALRGLLGQQGAIGRLREQVAMASRINEQRLDQLRGRMVDAAATGYGLAAALRAPLRAGMDFETLLLDIAQKADLSDQQMRALGDRIRAMGPAVNRTAMEMGQGFDFLLGAGLDPSRAEAVLPMIGRTATAYRASIEDLSKAGFSVLANLNVQAQDFGRALDSMAQAGKEGMFELRDMATFFPAITASAQALGISGVRGVSQLSAALQIARQGAGDASQAANNVRNLMQKVVAPDAVNKFREMGVDIRREFAAMQRRGDDFFVWIANLVNKTLKGDLSKLGDLFQDSEVQGFLRPLIANLERYQEIQRTAANARGVVDADFARRVRTGAAAVDRLRAATQEFNIALGEALAPAMLRIVEVLTPMVRRIGELVAAYPRLSAAAVGATAGLIAFRVVAAAVGFALLTLKGGALGIAGAVLNAGRAFGILRAGALLVTGSGVLATIAAAGTWIYNNWNNVTAAFEGFKLGFSNAIAPVQPLLDQAGGWISEFIGWIGRLLGPVEDAEISFAAFGIKAGRALGGIVRGTAEVVAKVATFVSDIVSALSDPSALYAAGVNLITQLWEGMKAKFHELLATVASWPGQVAAALGLGGGPGSAAGPRSGAGAGSGGGTPRNFSQPVQRRAGGGDVRAGQPYLVGERRAELFVPDRDGTILPDTRGGAARGLGGGGSTINFSPTINVSGGGENAAERIREVLRSEVRELFRGVHADAGIALG